jgi:hypothetical protein
MAVVDLFSKRQKRLRGEVPDIYIYDDLPQKLRVQIVHIIRDAFGVVRSDGDRPSKVYRLVNDTLCRELGVFKLNDHTTRDGTSVFTFFLKQESVEQALDVVELCFRIIILAIESDYSYKFNTERKIEPLDAIAELNERFKEHGVGYQFESGEIIRVDSQFLHAEAVKPALSLLKGDKFRGANEEFLKAHEHYRHGRYKECLVDALKSFESTMKTICGLRGWETQPTNTAKNLISICLENGLLAPYSETQLSSLRSLLESGIPTIRNKHGGHGQGVSPIAVPGYLARYALNLTATTILMMVEANNFEK